MNYLRKLLSFVSFHEKLIYDSKYSIKSWHSSKILSTFAIFSWEIYYFGRIPMKRNDQNHNIANFAMLKNLQGHITVLFAKNVPWCMICIQDSFIIALGYSTENSLFSSCFICFWKFSSFLYVEFSSFVLMLLVK